MSSRRAPCPGSPHHPAAFSSGMMVFFQSAERLTARQRIAEAIANRSQQIDIQHFRDRKRLVVRVADYIAIAESYALTLAAKVRRARARAPRRTDRRTGFRRTRIDLQRGRRAVERVEHERPREQRLRGVRRHVGTRYCRWPRNVPSKRENTLEFVQLFRLSCRRARSTNISSIRSRNSAKLPDLSASASSALTRLPTMFGIVAGELCRRPLAITS